MQVACLLSGYRSSVHFRNAIDLLLMM